jgi:hypothetical protein
LAKTKVQEAAGTVAAEVRSLAGLQMVAKAVADQYGDKGAIVVTYGKDSVRLGSHGLSPAEAENALCIAIYYHILFAEKSIYSWELT